jgi:hypothetical protein
MTDYIVKRGKGVVIPEEEEVVVPKVKPVLTAREVLQEAMQEAWTQPQLRTIRRSLKSVGQNLVAPAYEDTAQQIGLAQAYEETAKRIKLDKAYEEIWA